MDSAYFNRIEGGLDSAWILLIASIPQKHSFSARKKTGTRLLVSKIGRKPEEGARRK